MVNGKLFQSLGAATVKALSPLDLQREQGIDRRSWLLDLKDLHAVYGWMRSQMYCGADLCMAL